MERRIPKFPNSKIESIRLGFGCAYLTGGIEKRQSIRMIQSALAAGIRHFDVAPSYGSGTAEEVLGSALTSNRTSVTISSKVGLQRGGLNTGRQLIKVATAPLRRVVARHFQSNRAVKNGERSQANLDLQFVKSSLEDTMRSLKTNYLDALLLHEAQLQQLNDELLSYLARLRSDGIVLNIGIASTHIDGMEIIRAYPCFFDIVQYPWNAFDKHVNQSNSAFQITHRAIMGAKAKLQELGKNKREVLNRLSQVLDDDLWEEETFADWCLCAALSENPCGMVLVGTRHSSRMIRNLRVLESESVDCRGRRFLESLSAMTALVSQ